MRSVKCRVWSVECEVWSAECKMQSVRNTASTKENSIPHTTDVHQILRLPRKMTMEVSKVLRLPRKMQAIYRKRRKSIAPATQNDFQHVCRHMRMSRSATPATQNDITTSFATFKKDRFCSFPHRHRDATRKPKKRDETGCIKMNLSCETS